MLHKARRSAAVENYSLASLGSDIDLTTNSASFSFSNAGPEGQNRTFVAAITYWDNDVGDNPTSIAVTIGGVSATTNRLLYSNNGSVSIGCHIASAVVPTGTTIAVTAVMTGFTGTTDQWSCILLRAPAISTTELANATGTDNVTITPTASAKFVVIAGVDYSGTTTGATINSGGGSRTTVFANNQGVSGYDSAPNATSTVYDFSEDTDATVAAAFGLA